MAEGGKQHQNSRCAKCMNSKSGERAAGLRGYEWRPHSDLRNSNRKPRLTLEEKRFKLLNLVKF